MENNIICLKGISKIYRTEAGEQTVLKNIDFSINKGEFIGVIGDSGSGKTTFLNLLGALDTPSEGEIYILNKRIDKMKEDELSSFRRNHIGYIFQDYNLIEELTVYENVIFSAKLKGLKINENTVAKLLKLLKLEEKKDKFPAHLSGGERQRTAILRSVVGMPDIILADEPTGNLDEQNTQVVVQLLKFVNDKFGSTILMVTHNSKLTEVCKRVVAVKDGRLVG